MEKRISLDVLPRTQFIIQYSVKYDYIDPCFFFFSYRMYLNLENYNFFYSFFLTLFALLLVQLNMLGPAIRQVLQIDQSDQSMSIPSELRSQGTRGLLCRIQPFQSLSSNDIRKSNFNTYICMKKQMSMFLFPIQNNVYISK